MGREGSDETATALAGLTAREALTLLTQRLAAAGIEDAWRDARLLLLAGLGLSAIDLMRAPERRIGADEALVIAGLALRRAVREPVSRILGTRGFFGRTFDITAATLDPRPCTETVIEAALALADEEGWCERPIRILDVGTGSGALLVTLLAELPLARGVGTDISDDALAAAAANAGRLGVAERASFLNRRSLSGVDGPFDLLVSNPPYIPSDDIAGLAAEVREFDPLGALDGGPDGLAVYRELAGGLDRCVPDGWVLVEVGAGQAEAVGALFRGAEGATGSVRTWTDLGQHTRCVAVRTQR